MAGQIYRVERAMEDFRPTLDWDGPSWAGIEPDEIASFPWDEGGHRPTALFKISYSDAGLHVIFRVEDRYVRSLATEPMGRVWEDACVELFFSPCPDAGAHYFNIETNCGGTALIGCQRGRGLDPIPIAPKSTSLLQITHSMPSVVEPELAEACVWTLAYRVPFAFLSDHVEVVSPEPGVEWRANLYKCAETNSQPHWGSWSPIVAPKPDFHRPECFGVLRFAG